MTDEEREAEGFEPIPEERVRQVRENMRKKNDIDFDRYVPEHERARFRIDRIANFHPGDIDIMLTWTYDRFEAFYWRKIAEQHAISDYQERNK